MTMQDDEDWLSQAAEAGRSDIAATPAAGGNGGAGTWAKVQELLSKQQGMQYQAPERFSQPITAAPPPSSKDNDWKTVLAMALNVLGDKGRGLGNVMQAGAEARNRELRDWRAANSPQALQQRELMNAQLRNADRQGFEHDRAALGQQAQQLMAMAGAEDAQMRDERNFDRLAQRDIAGDVQHQQDKAQQAEQFAAGQTLQRDLQREQIRASNANAAASRAQAEAHFRAQQEQHRLDQDNQLNRDRDAYAHSDAARREGYEHDDKELAAKAQLQKDLHDLTHPTPVAPEGWRVKAGQDAQWRQAMGNKGVESTILKEIGNAQQIQNTLNSLVELRSAPSSAANKRLYDAAIKSLIGDRSQEGSTGVLSGTEFERYLSDLPEYGSLGNVSTMRGAYDVFRGRDPAIETLQGMKRQFRGSMAAKASPYGIEWADEGPSNPNVNLTAAAPVAPAAPQVDDFTGIPGLTKKARR